MGSWDFEKGLLVFMLLLILGGVGAIWWQERRIDELVGKQAQSEAMLSFIGQRAYEIQAMDQELIQDELAAGEKGAYEYLEDRANQSNIGMTKFKFQRADTTEYDGWVDDDYDIQPASNALTFSREEIGIFLLYIEVETARMTVTRLKLDLARGRNVEEDRWRPRITVTDRRASTVGL